MSLWRTLFRRSFLVVVAMLATGPGVSADNAGQLVRLAKLVIDEPQLAAYRALLIEEIETSMRLEPGVRTLYAVADKDRPAHITILEIYADRTAYEKHLRTAHFLKYKTGTEHMVRSLELIETVPLIPDLKIK
jgi:quinol monooxygenase YgiN